MLTFFTNCYRDLTFSLLLYRVNMPFVLVREVFFHLSYFPPLFLLPVSEGKTFYLFPPLSCWVLLWKGSFSVILFHEISPLIFSRGELIYLVLAWSMARSPTIALNLGRSFLRKHDLTSQQVVILTFGFYVWRWWSDSAKTPYVLSTCGETPVSEYHNCCEHWRVATLFLFFRLGPGYFSSRCVHGDLRPKGSH